MSRAFEKQLEKFRQVKYPDLPSRLNCVYATFKPRSRFLRKGYLYRVKPIGKTHVADSELIDSLDRSYERGGFGATNLMLKYWEGIEEPGRYDMNSAEILMESARVVEVVDEKQRMQLGMKIRFSGEAPKIRANLNVYGPVGTSERSVYSLNEKIPLKDGLKRLEVPGVFVSKALHKSEYSPDSHPVVLAPGFEGFIVSTSSPDPGSRYRGTLQLFVSPSMDPAAGVQIDVDESEKFMKAFRAGTIERL